MRSGVFAIAWVASGLLFSPVSSAAVVTGSLPVSANVAPTCKIVSTGDIDFDNLDAINAMGGSVSRNMQVQCTAGTTGAQLRFDQGLNPSAGSSCITPHRRLKSGTGHYLTYEINVAIGTSPMSAIGCDASSALLLPTFTSSLEPVIIARRALWHPGQDLQMGAYVDTLNVSLEF